MTRLRRLAIIIPVVLFLCAVIVVILTKTVLTPEKIRETLMPLIEKELHRKVAVEDVDIGLFSGVVLQEVTVAQEEGKGSFLRAEKVQLHYQLWPLLRKKVVIDQITLVGPRLTINKNADGTFNFSDLLGHDKKAGTGAAAQSPPPSSGTVSAPEPRLPAKTPASGMALLVNTVSIEKGLVSFIDESITGASGKEPLQYTLKEMALTASSITLNGSFPFQLSAIFNETPIRVEGTYDISRQRGGAKVEVQPLQLAAFSPYLQAAPVKLSSALLSLSAQADFSTARISVTGNILADKIDIIPSNQPQAALQQAKLQANFDLLYTQQQRELRLSSLDLNFNGIPVTAKGAIGLLNKEPQVDLTVQLRQIELAKFIAALPAGVTGSFAGYRPSGAFSAAAVLKGGSGNGIKLVRSGVLWFTDAGAEINGKKATVNGSLKYDGVKLDGRALQINYAEQLLSCDLAATSLFVKPIEASALLTAERLDLNKMLPAPPTEKSGMAAGERKSATAVAAATQNQGQPAPSAPSAQPTGQPDVSPPQEAGPFDIPVHFDGKIGVKSLLYKALEMKNLQLEALLNKNRLTITKFAVEAASGRAAAKTEVDLASKGLQYNGDLEVNGFDLAVLQKGLFAERKEQFSGTVQTHTTFSGHGTIADQAKKTLQLKGQTTVANGKLAGIPLVEELAVFIGNTELRVLSFNNFVNNYTMHDGVIELASDLQSPVLQLKPQGTVNLDGPLDIRLNARMAPVMLSRVSSSNLFQQTLSDADGWSVLPVKLAGTIEKPKFALDSAALEKQAVNKAREQLLNKLLPAKTNDSEGTKLFKNTLNQLFGK